VRTTTAVYPGSFDPITNGHVDIILRGAAIFDRIVVLVAINRAKQTLFSLEERLDLIRQVFADHANIEAQSFRGLLATYLQEHDIRAVIRGLRAVSDFEYEFQMALMNRKIHPEAETLFLASRENYSYVSSRILKEVFSLGGCIQDLAPPIVIDALRRKYPVRGANGPTNQ